MPTLRDGRDGVELSFAPLKGYGLCGLQQNSTAYFRHSERPAPSLQSSSKTNISIVRSNLVQAGKLLVSIREMFGSNLGRVLTILRYIMIFHIRFRNIPGKIL
jgi:hypothetical protein